MKALAIAVAVVSSCAFAATAAPQPTRPQTSPAGWSEVMRKTLDLGVEGKDLAVLEVFEKWVAEHPGFPDGHFMLGAAHETLAHAVLAGRSPGDAAAVQKHFEDAAAHMRRGLDLAGPDAPFVLMRGLMGLYDVTGLNQPVEYERLVREAVRRYPTEPIAHAYLLALLASKGEPIEPAARAARAVMRPGAASRAELAGALVGHVRHGARLMPGLAPVLMPEARKLVDEALSLKPGDAEAIRVRGDIEAVQAMMSSSVPAADEMAVRGALRAISSGQAAYSAVCGNGYYAPTLAALARPVPGSPHGFLGDYLVPAGGALALQRYGYRIEMTAVPSPASPASCNGLPAGGSARTFSIVARPLDGLLGRTFRMDADGNLTDGK